MFFVTAGALLQLPFQTHHYETGYTGPQELQRCNRRNVGTSWAQTPGNRCSRRGQTMRINVVGSVTEEELPILPMKPNRLELNPFEAVLAETKREGWRD